MRVLVTADTVGGVWTYALDLASGLTAAGHAVTLAVLGAPAGDARIAHARAAGATPVETGLPLDWLAERPEDVLAAGRALAGLAREVGADLVHLNSPALAAEAGFPCPVVGFCHSCLATWWDAVRGGRMPADFRWRTELLGHGYAGCDVLAAPSEAFASFTQATYRLSRRPTVIHNGRAAPPLSPMGRARAPGSTRGRVSGLRPPRTGRPPSPYLLPNGERDPAPAPEMARLALTAGRLWDEGKNVAAIDRAAARTALPVRAAGPTDGPNGARITLDHVEPLGALSSDDLADRLAQRPIFISLARYEPFGLAVLEAAQAGCPLVLSSIPTFRELWDGAATFVVDPDDDRAAAAALDAFAADDALRERQGALARERAAQYGVERTIAGTLALYERTAATPLRAAS